MLRRAASIASEASVRRVEVDRVLDERSVRSASRRDFIGRISLAAAATTVAPALVAGKSGGSPTRVVVIGAGLAGLTCAYRLKQAGVNATIYEANSRLGGRCWTRRGDFAEGQIAEHGGELIDQGHTAIRQLAQELRLPLDNQLAAEPNGTETFFHFGGAAYSYPAAVDDLKGIWQKVHRDLSESGYPTLYNRSTARGAQLDQMSISDWINESVPGGIDSRLGRLLDVAYNIEYGAECDQQSALSLLYLLTKTMKSKGVIALESHIETPKESSIFSRFPKIQKDHFAIDFICDTLRMMTMNLEDPHQVEDAMEKQLEKHHHEAQSPAHALSAVADGLPALGIVAAVLGVIKTMGSIDRPPMELGLMIGSALVGTFLGVFLAYGLVGPMANRLKEIVDEESSFYKIIQSVLVAHLHGNAAQISVEIGRGSVPSPAQPSFLELEEALNNIPAEG